MFFFSFLISPQSIFSGIISCRHNNFLLKYLRRMFAVLNSFSFFFILWECFHFTLIPERYFLKIYSYRLEGFSFSFKDIMPMYFDFHFFWWVIWSHVNYYFPLYYVLYSLAAMKSFILCFGVCQFRYVCVCILFYLFFFSFFCLEVTEFLESLSLRLSSIWGSFDHYCFKKILFLP